MNGIARSAPGSHDRVIAMATMVPALLIASAVTASADPVRFERREIADFPAPYQLAVTDVNGDGKPDVIVLSIESNRVDWFENPTWKQHPVARTAKNIDLAPQDIDGDGRPEIALASGFAYTQSKEANQIQWLSRAATLEQPWQIHFIATDPVVHRLRWGDLDGDGRPELIHAAIVDPGFQDLTHTKPVHLWAFRVPPKPAADPWKTWTIDESLTVLHGIYVGRLDQKDGRDEILTGSAEGIHRYRFEGSAEERPLAEVPHRGRRPWRKRSGAGQTRSGKGIHCRDRTVSRQPSGLLYADGKGRPVATARSGHDAEGGTRFGGR